MKSAPPARLFLATALGAGVVAGVVAFAAGLIEALVVGLLVLGVGLLVARSIVERSSGDDAASPERRRFLGLAAAAGAALVVGGSATGHGIRRMTAPDPEPALRAAAHDLGAEYMELVRRTYHPGRSGDLQLVLAPFNSSNYAPESLHLVPKDPRSSHASVWLYLERVPMVVWSPGLIPASDSADRVSLADLAPTTAALMGFSDYGAVDGHVLPGIDAPEKPPKVIVTFVIDGGGWNVLRQWPDSWPNLERLMGQGANYRNALTGSFPAVTACAHATIGTGAFPHVHGITGHNIRVGDDVRKAYGVAGQAQPSDILIPTLADRWSDSTDNDAWVGEIGYQVWHLGMLGHGGQNRGSNDKPVAVYWGEDLLPADRHWQPQNPDLYRMPASFPDLGRLTQYTDDYSPPGYDSQFDPTGKKAVCCSPPIIKYQGDLIESTFDSEPIGEGAKTSLLYINFKAPDYTGHTYNMLSKMTEIALRSVDEEIGRVARLLQDRYAPGEAVLIVTADHGQCPLMDTVGGTRVDPIQLGDDIEQEFRRGVLPLIQEVEPSEIFLSRRGLSDSGVAGADIAAWLADYRYRDNIGPYVPRSVIEMNLLNQESFAAVFPTSFLDTLARTDPAIYGATSFAEADLPMGPRPRTQNGTERGATA